jgi:hypothetical protein
LISEEDDDSFSIASSGISGVSNLFASSADEDVEEVLFVQDKSSHAEEGSSSRPCSSSVAQTNNERNSPPLKDLIEEGVFVIVIWQGMEFPGKVAAANDDGAIFDCMEKTSKCWQWPKYKDMLFYKWCDVNKIINVPKPLKRFFFQCQNFQLKFCIS